MTDQSFYIFIIIIAFILLLAFFSTIPIIRVWRKARRAGIKIKFISFFGMSLRKIPPDRIIYPLIKAEEAGLNIKVNWLEHHYLAGGNVDRVVDALIAAKKAEIPLDFIRASAFDLAGRDMQDAMDQGASPAAVHKD